MPHINFVAQHRQHYMPQATGKTADPVTSIDYLLRVRSLWQDQWIYSALEFEEIPWRMP